MNEDELLNLFPIPLSVCSYGRDYSKELEWIKKQEFREPSNVSTTNKQSTDTFILDNPELKKIRTFIETKLNTFVSKVYGSADKLAITQSWLNKNGKGESHHDHIHPNSMISGVWYPQIHEKLPPIQFRNSTQRDISLDIKNYNLYNSATFLLPLKPGELVLFPSNLNHSVPSNHSTEERISLSFNTWPKGNMGTIASLTYLPFDRLN